MNFGRTFRIKERASLNLRIKFTNIFNRSAVSDPSNTNIKAQITTNQYGNYTGGYGFINGTSVPAGAGVAGLINNLPRQGTAIARFTF